MTKQTTIDPFTLWKSMYEKTEANLNDVIHENLKKEEFAEWLGQLQSGFLQYQQMLQGTNDSYLKQMNIPTRAELSCIAELIINLEEKVENIDDKIEDELLNQNVSQELTKIKTNISKLDKKMDQILKAITTIENVSTNTNTGSSEPEKK